MDHESTIPLLTDLLSGRLAAREAEAGWAHVGTCSECQGVLATMHEVRGAMAARGPSRFSLHPTSDEIVSVALADPSLPYQDLARVRLHLETCEHCAREVELTRAADAGTGKVWRAPWAGLEGFRLDRLAPVLAPALAAMVLVLAIPAYQGAVKFPELKRQNEAVTRDIAALRQEQEALKTRLAAPAKPDWGGAIRLLYLPAETRGAGAAPRITLAPDQPTQPIVVGHSILAGGPDRKVQVSIVRVPDQTVAWSTEATASQLWDPVNQSVIVLVPTRALSPGSYRLEIAVAGEARPEYGAPFEVTAK